jgi:protease-4
MSFAGRIWKFLVGVKDALALLFLLLFFAALFAVLSFRPSAADIRDGALLLKLDGVVVEEVSPVDPLDVFLAGAAPVREFAARDLVRAIDAARTDERVKAVVLDLDAFLGGGQAHLTEIGAALARVRATDKPVLAYATAYGDDAILLAAHADEIWMNPLGGAIIAGPGGNRLYYGELLDKLEINARIYRSGAFKSAGEPFERSSMSDEARADARALYSALWEEWQATVRKVRPQLDLELVAMQPGRWIETADGDLAQAALSAGLVDRLAPRRAFETYVAQIVGENVGDGPIYAHTNLAPWLLANPEARTGSPIGIVTIAGTIIDGDAGPGTAGAARIEKVLDDALDRGLAGLVVRVDSPGGSVLASEVIRQAILRHEATGIPVGVSMANVAASGGYWVSMPGDRIFAEPESITGSIGVIAIVPTFEQLADEIGVNSDGVTVTPLGGQPDFIGGFDPLTERILEGTVQSNYRGFLRVVAEGRNMPVARVDELAQGRVYDGGTARQLNLVDQYGGLFDAVEWVAAQAGLEAGGYHTVNLGWDGVGYGTMLRQLLVGEDAEAASAGLVALVNERRGRLIGDLGSDLEMLASATDAQALCLECGGRSRAAGRSEGLMVRMLDWLRN